MRVRGKAYRTVWLEGARVHMIEQRLLPHRFEILICPTYRDTAEAIKTMAVRGAGAIGAAAGYALAQAALEAPQDRFEPFVEQAALAIRATRPTARDLFYAVEHMQEAIRRAGTVEQARQAAVTEAERLADENAAAGERIGIVGEPLLREGAQVLTHCNAGWLAFVDWGSALAPIYKAHRSGKHPSVYATETRPRSQGAKLTAWELGEEGVSYTLIADTACGWLFRRKQVDCVIVGADRIAANGDTANKIGTYTIAVLAREHGVPFYVAAPRSTFDLSTPNGEAIVIEERSEDEVRLVSGEAADGSIQQVRISPPHARANNPAFDVTPASLIRAFITDSGVIPPGSAVFAAFLKGVHALAPS